MTCAVVMSVSADNKVEKLVIKVPKKRKIAEEIVPVKRRNKDLEKSVEPFRRLERQIFTPTLSLLICELCNSNLKKSSGGIQLVDGRLVITLVLCEQCSHLNLQIQDLIQQSSALST